MMKQPQTTQGRLADVLSNVARIEVLSLSSIVLSIIIAASGPALSQVTIMGKIPLSKLLVGLVVVSNLAVWIQTQDAKHTVTQINSGRSNG